MEYRHTPVLLAEVMQHLSLQSGSTIVDCTLGGAGHSRRIQELIGPDGLLVGIDQDPEAIIAATDTLRLGQQLILRQGNFADIDRILAEEGIAYVDGFLFDLGVSSRQLDAPERGFTYREDAPLDMRMDQSSNGPTAADFVNTADEAQIARIISVYGEDRWASRIASFIVAARGRRPLSTTGDLIEAIKEAVPASARRSGGHPARKTFQALRIAVNREMEVLESALLSAVRWLSPGGRLVVISYHSLEDRIVKSTFRELSSGCICPPDLPVCACGHEPVLRVVTTRPVAPSQEEIEANPRSRSARLRTAEKI